jgi:uncharacterized protein YbaA (DUF1428 family)
MAYVDGFVLPVPKRKLKTYRQMAAKAAKIWREHGALEVRECVGEHLQIKGALSFPKQIRTKPGETVVFSWIVYRSRKQRDRVLKKVMSDPRLNKIAPKTMPFDVKRMAYGGFKVIVAA